MKRKTLFIIIVLLVLPISITAIVLLNNGHKQDQPSATNTESSSIGNVIIPAEHHSEDEDVNVFNLKQISSANDTIVVELSLNGKVDICRYGVSIKFDPDVLTIIDYDEDLSVFSPVVYPGKNEDGSIMAIPEAGLVNLEWASATNVTKEGSIIRLSFKKNESSVGLSEIGLFVKGVNTFNDGIVGDVEYNTHGLTLDLH